MIDTPDELYYNPSTRTLYADNFSGAMPSLTEGEAVKLTTDNNTTKIDVDFSKNTDIVTTLLDHDTLLVSNTSNALKTIRADLLKSDIRLTAGDNLSYGTDSNSNRLSLDSTIQNTNLNSGCAWNGDLILASKLSNGEVSDAEFQNLDGVSSAILQDNMKGIASGVCGLDSNGFVPTSNLPASIDDIRNFANVAAFPEIGETPPPEAGIIYVALGSKESYRWNGLTSGTNADVYTEITNGLVLGTGLGTAFEGSAGAANTTAIAGKQDALTATSTSGIFIDASDNIDIDLTKTNLALAFNDNELMLIQKSNGSVCRLRLKLLSK